MPKEQNRTWNVKFFDFYRQDRDVKTFLSFYREKNLMRFDKAKKYAMFCAFCIVI